MQLTVHRGAREIGGSCIEISTLRTRIILDVGLPLESSTTGGIERPIVAGLFAPSSAPPVSAILLSHAHADHSGLISASHPKIPVWMSRGTSKMLMCTSIFAGQPRVPRERQRICTPIEPFTIGDIRVTAFNVDHSAFDALAFCLEADGRRALYSGDLRLHGRKPGMAKALIAAFRRAPIDALLMEGTHVGRGGATEVKTERQLEDQITREAFQTRGVVCAMFSPANVDRLVTFYRAALRTRRTFVVDPYTAFVLHVVCHQAAVPSPWATPQLRVCVPPRFWESPAGRMIGPRVGRSLQKRIISGERIAAEPNRWLMVFRDWFLDDLFGGTLPAGSLCIHSYWHGYLQRPGLVRLKARLKGCGCRFIQAHSSGHIYLPHIGQLVSALNPRHVIPIHTGAPYAFSRMIPRAAPTRDGIPIHL